MAHYMLDWVCRSNR